MRQVQFLTIARLLQHRALETPSAVAMRSVAGENWTFEEMRDGAFAIAASLPATSGAARIGIVMANGPSLTLSILGATLVGAAAPLNPSYKREEFRTYFSRLKISCLLLDDGQAEAAAAAAELSIPIIRLERGKLQPPSEFAPTTEEEDTALILLTSGSTGIPKSVPLSHRNLCVSAAEVAESVDLAASDVCLSMWELYHIGGLVDLLLAPVFSGGTILCTSGFSASGFFSSLQEKAPTWFQAVPTALNEIVALARRDGLRPQGHKLRFIRSVAAMLPESLQAELEELFEVPVIQTFGMTEAGPLITSTRLPPAVRKPGSVGSSCGTEIRILGARDEDLPTGQTGEVAIRGANVFSGYEGDEDENKARFRQDWFLTGDLGWIDAEGDLFLAGRTKQLINRGGEKINPHEVDAVLRQHEAVGEVGVFAVEHKTLGEDIAAAVTLKPGMQCTEAELKALASSQLIAFKVPQRILFLDALPRTPVGKPDFPELARLTAAQLEGSPTISEDDVETELAQIWAREMNLDSIGLEENFFAAGGDSLAGMRVLTAVEQWLGSTLPAALLGEISTVRDMASKLRAEKVVAPSSTPEPVSPLIHEMQLVMQSGQIPALPGHPTVKAIPTTSPEVGPPLFWCFNSPDREMSGLLKAWSTPRTIYGLYSASPEPEAIAETAKHYCEVIQAMMGSGPFFLGGNCRGARVVEKMLLQMHDAGALPLRAMIMEYPSMELDHLPIPQLYIFGKKSRVPKVDQKIIKLASKQHDSQKSVAKIRGRHAQFFWPENVESLEGTIQSFLASTPKS